MFEPTLPYKFINCVELTIVAVGLSDAIADFLINKLGSSNCVSLVSNNIVLVPSVLSIESTPWLLNNSPGWKGANDITAVNNISISCG